VGDMKFKIVSHLFRLKGGSGKFHKELNMVSWNDREPVYDLRGWNDDHTEMTKGVTFSDEEYEELVNNFNEKVEE